MIKKIILILGLFAIISGCNSIPELSVYQRIEVPAEYKYGKDHSIGMSDYERYLHAYEQAFWCCIKNRAKNIDYKYKSEDLIGNGWPPAIAGTRDGYLVAENHINSLIEYYGKTKVQKYLREITGYEFTLEMIPS